MVLLMPPTIADNLRRVMTEKGVDADELARRLKYKARGMVDHWLAGRRAIGRRNLERVARALVVQIGEIDPAEDAYTPSKRKARAAEKAVRKRLLRQSHTPPQSHVAAPPQPSMGVTMGPGDQALFDQIVGVWMLCRDEEERHALVKHVRSFVERPEPARKKVGR